MTHEDPSKGTLWSDLVSRKLLLVDYWNLKVNGKINQISDLSTINRQQNRKNIGTAHRIDVISNNWRMVSLKALELPTTNLESPDRTTFLLWYSWHFNCIISGLENILNPWPLRSPWAINSPASHIFHLNWVNVLMTSLE